MVRLSHCSGAMYSGVPTIIPAAVWALAGASRSLAMPKSSSFTNGAPRRFSTNTLSGLRSRCTTPRSWAPWSASQSWRRMATASGIAMGPRRSKAESASPSRYSMTMKYRLGGSIERSKIPTMFSCPMRFTARASS